MKVQSFKFCIYLIKYHILSRNWLELYLHPFFVIFLFFNFVIETDIKSKLDVRNGHKRKKKKKKYIHRNDQNAHHSFEHDLGNINKTCFSKYISIQTSPNGGASIVHVNYNELKNLKEEYIEKLVDEFFKLVFEEKKEGEATHVMGVVHDAARDIPELVRYFGETYPKQTVKTEILGKTKDIDTTCFMDYCNRVQETYQNGTFRCGGLLQFSLVGTRHEETGGYFPDMINFLEKCPFLKPVMPWGKFSVLRMDDPQQSNDGPIFWVRPGEQMVPATESSRSPCKRKR